MKFPESPGSIRLLFFCAGAALLLAGVLFYQGRPEVYRQENAIDRLPYEYIGWPIRGWFDGDGAITLSAQHRFSGVPGKFRFVCTFFPQKHSKREFRGQVEESPWFEASQPGAWSSWSCRNRPFKDLIVGVAWAGPQVPIYLHEGLWRNGPYLRNYAHLGHIRASQLAVSKTQVRLRGNFRIAPPQNVPIHPFGYSIAALLFFLGVSGVFIWQRYQPSVLDWVYGVSGMVFAYRLWAGETVSYWTWGDLYLVHFDFPSRMALAGGLLLACIGVPLLPESWFRWRISSKPWVFPVMTFSLVVLAWVFKCNRVYGDWIYGFTNLHHAPLTAAWYRSFQQIELIPEIIRWNLRVWTSIIAFVPFLIYLRRLMGKIEGELAVWALGLLFFLSLSTTQDFMGYVEIYSLPMTFFVIFAYYGMQCLEGKQGLYWVSIWALIGFMAHLTEAVLIFPLVFVWVYSLIRKRISAREFLTTSLKIGLTTIGIFAVTYFLLFWSVFESDYTEFRQQFPYFGFELLWGGRKSGKVLLMLNRIGPDFNADYTIFSWENLFKTLNFLFHYSAFCFFLPVILLIQNRFRDLRDPRMVFLGITFLTYMIFLILMRVSFYTPLLDWDLFAVLSVAGGLLTYALLVKRQQRRALVLITLVNLLHTIPWIGVNHFTGIYTLSVWK
jgi:hypothetical protein